MTLTSPRTNINKNAYTKHFDARFNEIIYWLRGAMLTSEPGKPLYELSVNLKSEFISMLQELHSLAWNGEVEDINE